MDLQGRLLTPPLAQDSVITIIPDLPPRGGRGDGEGARKPASRHDLAIARNTSLHHGTRKNEAA
jgi:hypothetical protein